MCSVFGIINSTVADEPFTYVNIRGVALDTNAEMRVLNCNCKVFRSHARRDLYVQVDLG